MGSQCKLREYWHTIFFFFFVGGGGSIHPWSSRQTLAPHFNLPGKFWKAGCPWRSSTTQLPRLSGGVCPINSRLTEPCGHTHKTHINVSLGWVFDKVPDRLLGTGYQGGMLDQELQEQTMHVAVGMQHSDSITSLFHWHKASECEDEVQQESDISKGIVVGLLYYRAVMILCFAVLMYCDKLAYHSSL